MGPHTGETLKNAPKAHVLSAKHTYATFGDNFMHVMKMNITKTNNFLTDNMNIYCKHVRGPYLKPKICLKLLARMPLEVYIVIVLCKPKLFYSKCSTLHFAENFHVFVIWAGSLNK
jgi:hypothetical protein